MSSQIYATHAHLDVLEQMVARHLWKTKHSSWLTCHTKQPNSCWRHASVLRVQVEMRAFKGNLWGCVERKKKRRSCADASWTALYCSSAGVGAEGQDGGRGGPPKNTEEWSELGKVIMHKEFIFICRPQQSIIALINCTGAVWKQAESALLDGTL